MTRTLDRRKRLLIAMDAAFGMEYLHGKNVVHFDIKCENLLVNMRDIQRPICKVIFLVLFVFLSLRTLLKLWHLILVSLLECNDFIYEILNWYILWAICQNASLYFHYSQNSSNLILLISSIKQNSTVNLIHCFSNI